MEESLSQAGMWELLAVTRAQDPSEHTGPPQQPGSPSH